MRPTSSSFLNMLQTYARMFVYARIMFMSLSSPRFSPCEILISWKLSTLCLCKVAYPHQVAPLHPSHLLPSTRTRNYTHQTHPRPHLLPLTNKQTITASLLYVCTTNLSPTFWQNQVVQKTCLYRNLGFTRTSQSALCSTSSNVRWTLTPVRDCWLDTC